MMLYIDCKRPRPLRRPGAEVLVSLVSHLHPHDLSDLDLNPQYVK